MFTVEHEAVQIGFSHNLKDAFNSASHHAKASVAEVCIWEDGGLVGVVMPDGSRLLISEVSSTDFQADGMPLDFDDIHDLLTSGDDTLIDEELVDMSSLDMF